jgi:2'-5' RNA ligase
MQYYRTFIALPLKAGQDLLALRSEIMSTLADERISWVDPGNFHITLRFLGDTGPDDVKKISEVIKSKTLRRNARNIPVTGVESFGPARMPRVIWAAFSQDTWFREIKTDLDNCLESLGLPPQSQKFTAHLTLGRIRSLKNVSLYHAYMQEIKARACDAVAIDRIVYYRSILGPKAPEYVKLSECIFREV